MQTVARLIDTFIPEHYQLSITLNREPRTFHGVAVINGNSVGDVIQLHAKDLIITSATVDGKEATATLGDNDELTITQDGLSAGRHIVTIAYSGSITNSMHGLYPCYYTHDGVKKELLATQLESHHAREVFPCVDEPAAKATFDLTLTTETGVSVLGNMPIKTQKEEDGQLVTSFETTPKMSSYLLAWVVGELQKKTAITKSGVEVNVWATLAHPAESLDFSLDIARRTIDFFDNYFDTPYPLPKADHVALPDFSAGAMENWGLITYREAALLVDPKTTGIESRHYIATVVAHELSHQWFGNLVTMKWWDDLWLNESFATLMEYIAVDSLHPEWDMWLDFASHETIAALRRDSIDGVQAVRVDVNHPDEINTIFDPSIVYAKGARLMRMLQQYVGDEAFRAGLKAYFETHAYGNTEGVDLWNALGKASGKDIASFMNAWLQQPGFPVVHVSQENENTTISQQRFFVGPHEESSALWPIPLHATDSQLPAIQTEKTATYSPSSLLRLNNGNSAHFITRYDAALLQQLVDETVKDGSLPLDRLQLLHEQSLLARGGYLPSAELVSLVSAYKNETSEHVWSIMSLCIGELKKFIFDDDAAEKALKAFALRIATPLYQKLGWEPKDGEAESDSKLRTIILGLVLYGEDADAIAKAANYYASLKLEDMNPEIRPLIIGSVVRHGEDETIVTTLIERYKKTSLPDLQQDISDGLCSTRSEDHIRQLLEYVKDPETIRPQDAIRWFAWLIRNRTGRTIAWRWLQDNWSWVQETFGGDKSYDSFPRYSAGALLTAAELNEYRAFFSPMLNDVSLTRVITIGLKEIEGRVQLIERDKPAVVEALAKL